MPPPCQQSCFPYRALSVRVRGGVGRGWHRPRLSNSCIPAPQTPPGAWPLHSGKADPRDPWTPPGQLRAGLPTQHGQGLSSGQPASHRVPCRATNEGSAGASIMQQQQLHLSDSRLNSSLSGSSAKGNIFGQLGARRTLAPWAQARGRAHQQRQKLLLSQSGNFTITAVRPERGPHLPTVHKEAGPFLGGQHAGTSSRHLLTEGRPSIEEVGHHLTLALDLDHTPALQLVCVGGQHLVHVCSDLRRHRKGEDRLSVTLSMSCRGHTYLRVPTPCCWLDTRVGEALHPGLWGTLRQRLVVAVLSTSLCWAL